MFKKLVAVMIGIIMVASGLVGCAGKTQEAAEEKKIVIASKPMTEQYIIAEMLTLLIENGTDIKVEKKLGIGGGTSNIHPAMVKGDIDIYPEYTGTGWMFVLKKEFLSDPDELYKNVKESYDEDYNIRWMELYGFNDTFGIAMKKETAEKYGIKTYSDLAKHSGELKLGAEYDFYEREDGYPGLKVKYGFDFKEKEEIDIGLKYQAIGNDLVDVINIFSTDGRLKEFGLVVLEDDMNFFPSYYATTLVKNETLEKYPELEKVLAKLDGKINNDEMIEMNYLVEIEKKDPADVAKEFLQEKGLL